MRLWNTSRKSNFDTGLTRVAALSTAAASVEVGRRDAFAVDRGGTAITAAVSKLTASPMSVSREAEERDQVFVVETARVDCVAKGGAP